MSSLEKYDLVVKGNLFLGKLIYQKDSLGRLSVKFCLGYKSNELLTSKNPDRYSLDNETPWMSKSSTSGLSLEYSYKFSDRKLEAKTEISGGPVERSFYQCRVPAESPLFVIKVSSFSHLREKNTFDNPLYIDEGLNRGPLILSFSFPGENGKPWSDESMQTGNCRTISIKTPLGVLPKELFILTMCDLYPRRDPLAILIPEKHQPIKRT